MSDKIREALQEIAEYPTLDAAELQRIARAALAELPAPVAVTEVIRVQACNLGRYGAAYDPASTHYAYSYSDQPDNVGAMKLGRAAATNAIKSHGDEIDRGLHLLQTLQAEGFGVFQIAAAPAAPVAQEPVAWQFREIGEGEWQDCDEAWHDYCCRSPQHDTRRLYTAPPAAEQPDTTTCDKYRAELYDEVWEKARDMGYGNVTEALVALERMKAGGDKP